MFAPQGGERIPENGAADRKSDKARNSRRGREPFANFTVILATTENDTADGVTPASARRRHDALGILAPIQPFKLPQIRLHAPILKFPNGFDHQARP